jgi:hypothetical protein
MLFCHPERSEGSRIFEILRSLRFLRMTDVGIFRKSPFINGAFAKT